MYIKKIFKNSALRTKVKRSFHSVFYRAQPKVKLVAVARNESAYLAEWIFHHLYFGFDNIEIHINNCSDNTLALLQSISIPRVTIIDADRYFNFAENSPQVQIYREAFKKGYREGYTHLMFLDIDEFWTPANLTGSVKQLLNRLSHYDIITFNWLNKTDENEPFSAVLSSQIFEFEVAEQVKSVYKTFIDPVTMNPHNVIDSNLRYCRDNGTEFVPKNEHYSRAPSLVAPLAGDRSFIIHRKYRSEKEYLSMLARGRPIGSKNTKSIFKDNRHGYIDSKTKQTHAFDSEVYKIYKSYMHSHLSQSSVFSEVMKGREFVNERYKSLLQLIEAAPPEEKDTLKRLLKNVKDEDAVNALNRYLTTQPA